MSAFNRGTKQFAKTKDRIRLWNIAVGDNVKVISGPSRGKVGKVQECLRSQNKIIVSGVNVVKKMLPLFLSQSSGLESQKFEYAAPIHYSNVQLVGDIPSSTDPMGPKRRVEIKRVHRGKTFYNKDKKLLTWRRWVPGENVFLPWPRHEVQKVDGPMDTKAAEVSATTYIETLRQSPIPLEMQHELRNKYSKFRRDPIVVEESALVADVEGIEKVDATYKNAEFTDDADLAQGRPTPKKTSRKYDPVAGLDTKTIDILAQAMSKTSMTDRKSN